MMESFQNKRDKLEDRGHEVQDHLRERAHDVNKRMNDELQSMRDALHRRPEKGGEWDSEKYVNMNRHQKLASRTFGLLTLANAVTVAGAAMTIDGMKDWRSGNYKKAVVKMGTGRCLDLLDGKVATKTKTRSATGAALDAGADKLLAAACLGLAVERGDMPIAEAAAHGLQQAKILRESILIKNAGGEPNPSIEGKHGMALLWLRAGGIVLSNALEKAGYQKTTHGIHELSIAASTAALFYNQQAGNLQQQERLTLVDQPIEVIV